MLPDEFPFTAEVVHQDRSVVMAVSGELDIATGDLLRQAVAGILRPNLARVTLEMSGVTFVDLVGLRSLHDIRQLVTDSGAQFRLRSLSALTRRVIDLTGFDLLQNAEETV